MNRTRLFILSLLFASHVFAAHDIQLQGKIQQPLPHLNQSTFSRFNASRLPASVTLLKIKLSNNAWEKLQARTQEIDQTLESSTQSSSPTKDRIQLGMNHVPVLDQGPHSTCVTFASVAAIEATYNQGDTISELCQLQLGRYLEKYGYGASGWSGSFGPQVLHQMQTFGVVSKAQQREQGCAGATEYPTYSTAEPEGEMSLTDYHAHTLTQPQPTIRWSSVLDAEQVFVDKINPDHTLERVLNALRSGDRLTFGVLLFNTDQGVAGAVGQHHAVNDTWVLTPDIMNGINEHGEFGGHEMIITGFDNKAVAVDNQGTSHQGLLTIRNSWGNKIGDQGDFYMSYDYFKALTIEVQRIRSD